MDAAQSALHTGVIHLTGNKEGSTGFMVLRVKPTPTRFPTNILYTPVDNALSL